MELFQKLIKINEDLYNFGIIYFNWWKTHSRDKDRDNSFRHIAKQSMTLILRMCYDELQEIKGLEDFCKNVKELPLPNRYHMFHQCDKLKKPSWYDDTK